jgi:hypothetical protein
VRQQQLQRQQSQRQQPRRGQTRLLGKASNTNGTLAAARKLVKKAVFCIDNIDISYTVEDIKSYINCLDVEVLSLFKVTSRRRRNEQTVDDRSAFRVCIKRDDQDRLLNPEAWPESVIISDWYFLPTDHDNAAKRRRVIHDNNAMDQSRDQQRDNIEVDPDATVVMNAATTSSNNGGC